MFGGAEIEPRIVPGSRRAEVVPLVTSSALTAIDVLGPGVDANDNPDANGTGRSGKHATAVAAASTARRFR